MMEITVSLLSSDEDLGKDCLAVLGEIAENEPKFFKKHFNLLF